MKAPINSLWKSSGLRRLVNAARYQCDGVRHALLHDPAIRQVSIACIALSVVAAFMPVSRFERLILVLSLLLIVLIEYINSAIEAVVDRVSMDAHPLSKNAKDFGSVAVAIAVLMSGLAWAVIIGPLLLQWLSTNT
jgi:diacylglycerol kinase (ATP)